MSCSMMSKMMAMKMSILQKTFDIPMSTFQAFATKFRPKTNPKPHTARVRMASDKWFGLDEASRTIWDRLDYKAWSIILG